MVAALLVTVPSADLTIDETLLPVGALCGIVRLICATPGYPVPGPQTKPAQERRPSTLLALHSHCKDHSRLGKPHFHPCLKASSRRAR